LMGFKANMDIRLAIDIGKDVSYMCKYVTKTETMNTRRTRSFFYSAMNQATNNGEETNTRVALNRYMTILTGSRPRGKEETCHLIDSNPLVYSSHSCRKFNLNNDSRVLEVNDEGNIDGQITVVDAYARRMDQNYWKSRALYAAANADDDHYGDLTLTTMNLNDFCQYFTVGQRGQYRNKIVEVKKRNYIQFTPSYSSDPSGTKYVDYCRLGLVRFKEWKGDYHAVYGGKDATENEIKHNWEEFLRAWAEQMEESGQSAPDFLQQEMIRAQEHLSVRSQNSLDGANQNDGGGLLSDDDDDDELEYSTLGVEYDNYDEQVADNIEWAEDANWNQTHHDFTRCLFPDPVSRLKQLAIQAERPEENLGSPINRNSLNQRQLKFIQLIETLLQYGPADSSTDGGADCRGVVS